MEKSGKWGENSTLVEAFAPSREDGLTEATDLIQELFHRGSLSARMRDARKVLCKRPFGWTRNRVDDVFEGKNKRIDSHEMDHLRALKAARRRQEIEEARNELRELDELRVRLARLEASLAVSDSAFHAPQIEAAREAAREAGGGTGGARGMVAAPREGRG